MANNPGNTLFTLVFVLFISSMILSVGVLTLDKFGETVREEETVTDETVAVATGAGTLTYKPVLSITFFGNATDYAENYTLTSANYTSETAVLSLAVGDGNYNCSYTYDKDINASTAAFHTMEAIMPIAEDWMPLIVTVSVLAIILLLVLRSFKPRA